MLTEKPFVRKLEVDRLMIATGFSRDTANEIVAVIRTLVVQLEIEHNDLANSVERKFELLYQAIRNANIDLDKTLPQDFLPGIEIPLPAQRQGFYAMVHKYFWHFVEDDLLISYPKLWSFLFYAYASGIMTLALILAYGS